MTLAAIVRRAVRIVAAEYWNGWLYEVEPGADAPVDALIHCAPIVDTGEILLSEDRQLRKQAWRPENDAWAFGAWMNDRLAAVCWVQARETYRQHGGLFRLRADEAELVQITTALEFRGRGVAVALIEYAAWSMGSAGFRKLYAKIWHDNAPSLRAFERAGWKRRSRFVSLRMRRLKWPLLFTFRVRPTA